MALLQCMVYFVLFLWEFRYGLCIDGSMDIVFHIFSAIRRALMCVDDENWSKVCKSGTVNLCVDSQQMIWIQSKKGAIHFKHHVPKYNVSGFAKDDEKLWCRWKVQDDLLSVCVLHISIVLGLIHYDVVPCDDIYLGFKVIRISGVTSCSRQKMNSILSSITS